MANPLYVDELHSLSIPKRPAQECRLYVKDLPAELNQEGLKDLFSDYGIVKSILFPRNANWAFITYKTHAEAELAIRNLHEKPPLNLRVSLAVDNIKSKEEKKFIPVEPLQSYEKTFTPLVEPNFSYPIGRAKLLNPNVIKTIPSTYPIASYNIAQNLEYPVPLNSNSYNPYEMAEPYSDTNILWTRGNTMLTNDGKRHVSFGRGYTHYELPIIDPQVEGSIDKVYEKRYKDVYVYGTDKLRHNCGKCLYCSKITKFTCQRCMGFYCDRQCQMSDWQRHRSECKSLPPLVKIEEANSRSSSEENIPTASRPLRRPKTLIKPTESKEAIQINEPALSLKASPLHTPQHCNQAEIPLINLVENSPNVSVNETIKQKSDITSSNTNELNLPKAFLNNNTEKVKDSQVLKVTTNESQKYSETSEVDKPLTRDFHETTRSSQLQNKYNRSNSDLSKTNNKINTVSQISTSEEKKIPKKHMDAIQIEKGLTFQRNTFLSSDKFLKVRVITAEDNEYWIHKIEDEQKLKNMELSLQEVAAKSQRVTPLRKALYAIKYENKWYRVVISNFNPIKVRFVDYGYEEVIENDDFRTITEFIEISGFAKKIRVINTKQKYVKADIIPVKMISVGSDNIINVEVQEETKVDERIAASSTNGADNLNQSTSGLQKITSQPPLKHAPSNNKEPIQDELESVINALSANVEGILQVHEVLKTNVRITLLPNNCQEKYELLLLELPDECKKTIGEIKYTPKLKDLVCGEREDGEWLRGYVSCLSSPQKLAIVDEGREMPVFKMMPCPMQFKQIYEFGAVCQVTDNTTYSLKEEGNYEFKTINVNKKNNDESYAEILITIDENTKVKAVVKPWKPFAEQKSILLTKLKNGTKICLTTYRSQHLLFARSLESDEVERFTKLMQSVAKHADQVGYVKEPLVVGQMVLSKFIDGNYYRGIINKVHEDNSKALISYVDFGNLEFCCTKELKPLPEELQSERSCAAKLVLKDVPSDVPMTKEASDYLMDLTGKETPLLCTFDGNPEIDGVYLKLDNGEVVNNKLKEILKPTWQKPDDNSCFMVHDLPAVPLGKVGETASVLVLYTIEEGVTYVMCSVDREITSHVFDIMPALLKEHCTNTEYYIPRANELCIALYENEWFRAVCLEPNASSETATVFFVDHGNVDSVKHKDIRLMTKDFMSPGALGNICTIKNLAPTDASGKYDPKLLKRITQLMIEIIEVKLISCDDNGAYDIEVPEIRNTLIREHLI